MSAARSVAGAVAVCMQPTPDSQADSSMGATLADSRRGGREWRCGAVGGGRPAPIGHRDAMGVSGKRAALAITG